MTVVNRLPFPTAQLMKSDGTPASGWKYKFYESGSSSTAQAAYSDVALTVPFTSLILNAYGIPDVDIFLDPADNYRLAITDENDTEIFIFDEVRDFARNTEAHFRINVGNPNGNVAGTAGTAGGSPSDAIFDTTGNIVWVCTTTGTAGTAVWSNITASLSGALLITGVLSPASFSTQQDDYDPADLATASTLRLNPGADSDVTGLAGGASGRVMTLININPSFRVNLLNQNAGSVVANRFLLPNSLDVALLPDQVCVLQYDGLTGRWRLKSGPLQIPAGAGQYISNARFAISVAANALTIALKTQADADPTPADPVVVAFKVVANGGYELITVTAALSLTVTAGSSLGFANDEVNLIHYGLINNSGSAEIAVSKDGALWTEDRNVSTTAEGGSGGADSAVTLYSNTARSNVPCRLCGITLITTGATAGNWSVSPTRITLVTHDPVQPFKNNCACWVNFTTVTTTAINDSFNVSSLTDNNTGDTTVAFAVAMRTAYYGTATSGGNASGNPDVLGPFASTTPTAAQLRVQNANVGGGVVDADFQSLSIMSP